MKFWLKSDILLWNNLETKLKKLHYTEKIYADL